MEWLDGEVDERGVRERPFRLDCAGQAVPGLVWTPSGAAGPRPLVLIGHGGASHKRSEYVVGLARRLARHHGMASVAIDGPNHGERRDPARDRTWWSPGVVDRVIAEWGSAVEALQGQSEIGQGPLGYWGMSMGARLGVPLIAHEPRIRAAVIGLSGPRPADDSYAKAAAAIACPVLVMLQGDDELVERSMVLALYDAIGSADKRMYVHPGRHQGLPPEAFDASEAFLSSRLTEPRPS